MRIVYHLGAHCTDEERLIRCLLKNRSSLAEEGILVPSPLQYRRLLRDTAMQLKGSPATDQIEAEVLRQILEGDIPDGAERMILSWDSFMSFPQWVLRGRLYGFAGERIRAFTEVFPNHQAEFHLALRNPATFLPALAEKLQKTPADSLLEGIDPLSLRWSQVVAQIRQFSPNTPLTVWCDEDAPLIWPQVMRVVTGRTAPGPLIDEDELLGQIMVPGGLARLRAYLAQHPPTDEAQRRRIVGAFVEKMGDPERLTMRFEMGGWTEETVEAITARYVEDVERIRRMRGVTVISA